jgi:hypothetical protein
MNINPALAKDYENISPIRKCENKPNQTQSNPISAHNKPKSNPISIPIMQKQTQSNPILSAIAPALRLVLRSLGEGGFKG